MGKLSVTGITKNNWPDGETNSAYTVSSNSDYDRINTYQRL